MPRKCKNDYEPMNDKEILLTITKLNGTKKPAVFDTWNLKKVKQLQWHVTANGYTKTGRDIGITDIIMGPPPKGFVYNHRNGIRADNREANLELVPDKVNKLMKKRKKKDQLPNGIFDYPAKNSKYKYRVRNYHNRFIPFKTLWEAFQFRVLVLVQKGANLDTVKIFLGQIPRAEYKKYWEIKNIIES